MAVSGVDTGLVVGQFIVGLVDGVDENDEPDMVGARGSFEFAPAINYVPVPLGDPNPFTLLRDPFLAVLDDEGYLCTPDPDFPTKPGKRGLRLFATDSPTSSVKNWTWKVTPKFVNNMGMPIASYIAPFDIAVPTDGVVDLAMAIKIPSSPGLGTEQVVVYAAQAQDAAKYAARQAEYAAEEASSAGISAWEATEIAEQAMAVSELAEAVAKGVQKQAEDGEFVPKISIGSVTTVNNPEDDIWVSNLIRNGGLTKQTLIETFPTTMKGDRGDPGGWTSGANLGTTDLNTITTPGLYFQSGTSAALDASKNYPVMADVNGSARGVLEVMSWSGGSSTVLQRYTRIGTGVTGLSRPRVIYTRIWQKDLSWSAWDAHVAHRVDNTAGRAVYVWDDLANRDQLIYGDTGWRDVSGDNAFALQNGWKAQSVHVRRTGSSIHYLFRVLDGTAATGVVIMSPPTGFRVTSAIPYFLSHPVIINDTTIRNIAIQGLSGTMQSLTGWTTGDRIVPILSTTMDTWPTSLPGTAVGIIPNL